MKTNNHKLSKKLLKRYWKALKIIEVKFYIDVSMLEKVMAKETGIKDIEFFWCDNEIVGIGDANRTIKLIHREN